MMKAEIITLEGRHNGSLETSRSRVIKGATWKKQRIVVMLPADRLMSTKVSMCHWNLIFPPNNAVFRMLCLGLEVGDAYSQAIDFVVNHPDLKNWEYILTMESDNMPPADGILRLIESMDACPHLSCIGGLYWTKGEGGCAQIWGDPRDPVLNFRPQPPQPDTVQECCGVGMGFNLWRIKMFKDKDLRKPWFKTRASKEGVGTQDLYFWEDARKHGYRCAVDTKVRVGHYDFEQDIVW
jgi:hypothetical protein